MMGLFYRWSYFFAAMASSAPSDSEQSLVLYWLKQVTLGPMVGIAVGFVGGHALEISKSRGWLSEEFQELSGVGLALLAWSAAGLIGGNGFIAAFTAGVAISCHADQIGESLREFGEAEGQWLSLATFLLFGVVSTGPLMDAFQWEYVAYAIASLNGNQNLASCGFLAWIKIALANVSVRWMVWSKRFGVTVVCVADCKSIRNRLSKSHLQRFGINGVLQRHCARGFGNTGDTVV